MLLSLLLGNVYDDGDDDDDDYYYYYHYYYNDHVEVKQPSQRR